MITLAFDSTAKAASVAVLDGEKLLALYNIDNGPPSYVLPERLSRHERICMYARLPALLSAFRVTHHPHGLVLLFNY